ncbi:hypothetical protein IG631_13749 [Alternaria alternata]|nr:hypothetical protein IG631_13749 [Alternaria alternata]
MVYTDLSYRHKTAYLVDIDRASYAIQHVQVATDCRQCGDYSRFLFKNARQKTPSNQRVLQSR